MAEFKTAEQYVVEKLEMMERELDNAKIEHTYECGKLKNKVAGLEEELRKARDVLNLFRDFIEVRDSAFLGIALDIYGVLHSKSNPEEVAWLMEYFDLRPEEDTEDA